MSNLAKMKADLNELEAQKVKLKTDIAITRKRYKVCLWLAGGGVALLPLYGSGIIMILAGGVMALFVHEKKIRLEDKLAEVNVQIVKLEVSMA